MAGAATFYDLDGNPATIKRGWDEIERLYPFEQFMDTRRGYGRRVSAGWGPDAVDVWVTNTLDSGVGSFRWAVAQTGNTRVKFAVTGDIVDPHRSGYDVAANTLIDGVGYPGTIYGSLLAADTSNVAVRYLSVTQPFAYGTNPSGACIGGSNAAGLYVKNCTIWDSGDVLFTSGAYYPHTQANPYWYTVDSCRVGPNPGAYAMMSPILGNHPGITPGQLNGINNDARNGKAIESAYDHNAVDSGQPFSDYDHVVYGTMVNNVVQGCISRNLKARSQYLDAVNNVVAKYGAPYNVGGSVGDGQGSAVEDNGTVNYSGNVYIPYAVGEEFLGFRASVAAAYGVAPIYATAPTADAIELAGTAKTTANVHLSGNWFPTGWTPPTFPFTTGFTPEYTLPWTDVSTLSAAQALVNQLEDTAATRVGNPFSITQPPSWRLVHTGTDFPA